MLIRYRRYGGNILKDAIKKGFREFALSKAFFSRWCRRPDGQSDYNLQILLCDASDSEV